MLRIRYTLHVAGGPFASLLLAVLLWQVVSSQMIAIVAFASPLAPAYLAAAGVNAPGSRGVAAVAAGLTLAVLYMSAVSLLSAVFGTIPLKYHGRPNDGLLVLRAWRQGAAFERQLALGALQGYVTMGWRPRRWSASLVQRALALASDPVTEYWACIYAYYWAFDTDDAAGAGAHLDRAMELYPSLARGPGAITLEAAYYLARHRGDVAAARAWAERGSGSRHEAFMRPRAEAAILQAEGRPIEALAIAEAGLAALAAAPLLPNETDFESDTLRELAVQAQQALAAVGNRAGA
jgi:hypothetical protein